MLKAAQIEHTKPLLYHSQHHQHPYTENNQHIDNEDEELLEDLLLYGGDEEGSYTHSFSSGSHYSQKYQHYLHQQSKYQQQSSHMTARTSKKSTNSSRERDALAYDTRNDTLLLAQFLATTGPEEYHHYRHPNTSSNITYQQQLPSAPAQSSKKQQQQSKRASKILNRFRQKRRANVEAQEALTPPVPSPIVQSRHLPRQNRTGAINSARKNHIPLPVYEPPSQLQLQPQLQPQHPHQQQQKQHRPTDKSTADMTGRKVSVESSNPPSKRYHHTYQQQHTAVAAAPFFRDSGIYSETHSDKDAFDIKSYTTHTTSSSSAATAPPTPPPSTTTDTTKAAPSTALPTHYQPCLSSMLLLNEFPQPPPSPPKRNHPAVSRTVPEAVKKRSVRLRHVQVQTEAAKEEEEGEDEYEETDEDPLRLQKLLFENKPQVSCPHCRQHITPSMLITNTMTNSSNEDSAAMKRNRPPSCPPGLSSGPLLALLKAEDQQEGDRSMDNNVNDPTRTLTPREPSESSSTSNNRLSRHEEQQKVLLDMIMKLKSQLDEEKQCRLELEKKFNRRVSFIAPSYQEDEDAGTNDDQESRNSNTSFISAEEHEDEEKEEEQIVELQEQTASRWTSTTVATSKRDDSFWLNNRAAFLLPE